MASHAPKVSLLLPRPPPPWAEHGLRRRVLLGLFIFLTYGAQAQQPKPAKPAAPKIEAAPLPPQKLEESLRLLLQLSNQTQDTLQARQLRRLRAAEIEGLLIDQTVSKIGRDFYDVFYAQWEPPAGLGDFTVVIREKPGRGLNFLVSVEVNDEELLELPLQPRYEVIEEAATYSVQVALGYLLNANDISQQLERAADDPGTEVF